MGIAAFLIPLLFVLLAGFIIAGAMRRQRAQALQLAERVDALGLVYEKKGDKAFRDAWAAVPGLPKRGEVNHVIFGMYANLPVTCFRHRYMVSNGHGAHAIMHWVFSTDTPAWPAVHVRRRAWLAKRFGHRSGVVANEVFDREWAIKAESREFGAELLSQRVQEYLARPTSQISKRGKPRWHFVGGKLCLVIYGDIKPENLRAGLDHLVGMWGALTPA